METTIYKLRVTMVEPLLGTQPQKDVATEYVTSRFLDELGRVAARGNAEALHQMQQIETGEGGLPADELETLPEMLEKGTTVFHQLDGKRIYYDYHVKGFLKESGSVNNGMDGVKALRSKVDNLVFVFPRRIVLNTPNGSAPEFKERPLRAQTMQGPRVSLARSEMLPEGTWFECELHVMGGTITEKILRGLLDYGKYKGFGQWRNGSYGRFTYTLERA